MNLGWNGGHMLALCPHPPGVSREERPVTPDRATNRPAQEYGLRQVVRAYRAHSCTVFARNFNINCHPHFRSGRGTQNTRTGGASFASVS